MVEGEPSTSSYGREFVVPVKCVKSMSDMDLWLKSMAYHDITHFLKTINEAVKGKKLRQILVPSRNAENILHVFNALHKMTDETPATSGNQASFNWFERMNKESMKLLKKALSSKFDPDLTEINAYFIESFGDPLRNEYRSIHELSFIMFLCVLYKIVALTERDNLYVGLKIFNAYLEVIRKLKSTYRMEPTGSGEDQCIPLIWGSAQLSEEPFESNRSFESNIIERYKNDYIVIHHIQQMNNEQSNQFLSILDDPWEIVNLFLIKKYERKVLEEFDVIQNVQFGTILALRECTATCSINLNKMSESNQSTTIWNMFSSQLRWTTISNKISKLISGRKH